MTHASPRDASRMFLSLPIPEQYRIMRAMGMLDTFRAAPTSSGGQYAVVVRIADEGRYEEFRALVLEAWTANTERVAHARRHLCGPESDAERMGRERVEAGHDGEANLNYST